MLRSDLDDQKIAWRELESYTLPYNYENTLKKIVSTYPHYYKKIVKEYRDQAQRQPQPLKMKDITKTLVTQNVMLLKNSIELWNSAIKSSDFVAPILFHYSFSCLNSFFVYSLFHWGHKPSQGHGINTLLSDELEECKIIITKNGLFKRLLDVFTLYCLTTSFSGLYWKYNKGLELVSNQNLYQNDKGIISLPDLLKFEPNMEYKKIVDPDEVLMNKFSFPWSYWNQAVWAYLIIFLSSSIARYRPALWASILEGNSKLKRDYLEKYKHSINLYTLGPEHRSDTGFIKLISNLMNNLSRNNFGFSINNKAISEESFKINRSNTSSENDKK